MCSLDLNQSFVAGAHNNCIILSDQIAKRCASIEVGKLCAFLIALSLKMRNGRENFSLSSHQRNERVQIKFIFCVNYIVS